MKHSLERIEELKRRKERLVKDDENRIQDKTTSGGSILPVINFRILDSTLEVNFISGLDKNFLLHEVIKVLEEEGAEVLTVSYSTVGDRVIYTIHSQVYISLFLRCFMVGKIKSVKRYLKENGSHKSHVSMILGELGYHVYHA